MSNFGWNKVFQLYTFDKWRKASVFPLFISIVLMVVFTQSQIETIIYLKEISALIISISPNILGFLLGGYALLMGFSGNSIVEYMSKGEDTTLYQKQNTVFAMALFSIFIGLVFAICVLFIVNANIPLYNGVEAIISYKNFNRLILFVLLYTLFYSLFAIKDMVINVFNFGQLIHFMVKKELDKKNKTEQKP